MEQNIEFEIETCRICKCALIHNVVNIRQKGLEKLISVSAIRKDGLFSEGDEAATNLRLHFRCRARYTHEKLIAAAVKRQNVNCESVFLETLDEPKQDLHPIDYESQCLFCAEDASEHFISIQKKWPKRRLNVTKVSKAETRESILKASFVNDDQLSYQVRERIQGVDLVALNARYHQGCFAKFFHPRRATGKKRGRPECTQISEQMEQVYKFVESYGSQFSIQDIKEAFPVDLPNEKTIRRKLIEHYGDKLAVMESKGKPSLYCFVSMSLKILHDQYLERLERQSNPETLDLSVSGLTGRASVVRAAANIILEDIKSRANEKKIYPTSKNFWTDIKSVVPNTLDIFLKILITDNSKDANNYDRKVTALAHTIVSAVRPRSFRSPLLMGISSMIHQKYSSKTLIDLLSSLGFCESHSEVNNFGNSTIPHTPCQQQTEANCESHSEVNKFENSTISHTPCQQQTEADCESHSEVNKFENSTICHPPCQQQTEAEESTQRVSDKADDKYMIEVPKEMLELISCKCKKSSRQKCSDDNCCNKFTNSVPYEEEVYIKEEKVENGMDPLESLEKTTTDNYVKAINKYEYDDGSDEDMENVCTVNLLKKRRM